MSKLDSLQFGFFERKFDFHSLVVIVAVFEFRRDLGINLAKIY